MVTLAELLLRSGSSGDPKLTVALFVGCEGVFAVTVIVTVAVAPLFIEMPLHVTTPSVWLQLPEAAGLLTV